MIVELDHAGLHHLNLAAIRGDQRIGVLAMGVPGGESWSYAFQALLPPEKESR